jgi:HTH-type transcriptional regulator/antitoxin HigA
MTVNNVLKPWASVNAALGLATPVRDEKHYTELLAFVEECFEKFGNDEHHPVFALVDLVAERIKDYEYRTHPWPDTSTPATMLKFLMDQHGIKQKDLADIGTQGVVSEILSGKRQINLRQAKALSLRFSVPVDVFA